MEFFLHLVMILKRVNCHRVNVVMVQQIVFFLPKLGTFAKQWNSAEPISKKLYYLY